MSPRRLPSPCNPRKARHLTTAMHEARPRLVYYDRSNRRCFHSVPLPRAYRPAARRSTLAQARAGSSVCRRRRNTPTENRSHTLAPGKHSRRRTTTTEWEKYRRCDCDLRQVQQERQQLQESIIKIQIHIRQGKRKVPYRPSGGGHTPGQQVRRGVGGCNSVWGEWRAACGVGGAWIWARQSRARNSSTFLSLSYSEQLSYLQPGYGIVMYVHAPDRPPGGMRVV